MLVCNIKTSEAEPITRALLMSGVSPKHNCLNLASYIFRPESAKPVPFCPYHKKIPSLQIFRQSNCIMASGSAGIHEAQGQPQLSTQCPASKGDAMQFIEEVKARLDPTNTPPIHELT